MLQAICPHCKTGFIIEDEDLVFYQKMEVPPPTFCPYCRFQRRSSYINVRNLYVRDIPSKKGAISMYSPDNKLNIVEDSEWWGDRYDFLSYGVDYDVAQPFFSQFHALMKKVPLPHLQRNYTTFENSDYCNAASWIKNCYLIINADKDEDCMYGFCVEQCRHCIDIIFTDRSELCYEGINLKNCYQCVFCDDCEGSSQLRFCRDCVGCTDCFGCMGLRHKFHHIFNKPYSPAEYKKKLDELQMGAWTSVQKIREQVAQFFLTRPHKFMHGRQNQDVEGDYLYQCKNVTQSYLVEKAEDCKFGHLLRYLDSPTQQAYDYTMFGVGAELVYEAAWCGLGVHNVKFSLWNYGSSDIEYCFGCHFSQNLFGCIGLRQKKYCIFNKQYTKVQHEELVPKIKQQMMQIPYVDAKGIAYRYGEFFPAELSPFCYNQTFAQEFCPLTQEACAAQHYGWYENKDRKTTGFQRWQDLPDTIGDVQDDLIRTPILCKAYDENPTEALAHNCTQVFKIIPQELAFYRQMELPLPRYCHNTRYYHRLRQLNPFQLWKRECMCTSKDHAHSGQCPHTISTSFAPHSKEMVYCEACYVKRVY